MKFGIIFTVILIFLIFLLAIACTIRILIRQLILDLNALNEERLKLIQTAEKEYKDYFMSKIRNTKSGRYTTTEEAATNPHETVQENDRRAVELRNARKYISELRVEESDSLETEAFICGVEKALSFFSK